VEGEWSGDERGIEDSDIINISILFCLPLEHSQSHHSVNIYMRV